MDLTDFYNPVHNRKSASKTTKPVVLSMRNASFEFHTQTQRRLAASSASPNNNDEPTTTEFILSNISFQVVSQKKRVVLVYSPVSVLIITSLAPQKRGDLVCITGSVGSGKSSILSAITGDMNCVGGSISLQDVTTGFGYVSQSAWLQRGTIRNNIVWGQIFDGDRYNAVVHACGLLHDLEQLGGDDTYVGDKGLTLSGGQRMRVSLARSIYQNKQIYLLDDILSCLDAHVANHVIKYCIFGLLANKTRLVVTEQRSVLRRASQILHLDKGEATTFDSAKSYTSDLSDDEEEEEEGSEGRSAEDRLAESIDSRQFGARKVSADRLKVKPPIKRRADREDQQRLEEGMEMGALKRSTLLAYWRAASGRLGVAVLLSVLLMQISRNYSDVLLAQWVAVSTDNATDPGSSVRVMGMYSGVVLLNSLLTLLRSFLFAYAGIKAAICIHDKLLRGVVYVSNAGKATFGLTR